MGTPATAFQTVLRLATIGCAGLLVLGTASFARAQPCNGGGSISGGDRVVNSDSGTLCFPTSTTYGGWLEVFTPRTSPHWVFLEDVSPGNDCTSVRVNDLVYWACSGLAYVRLQYDDGCQVRPANQVSVTVTHPPGSFHWSSPAYSDWYEGANWSLGYVPTNPNDTVYFDRPNETIGVSVPINTAVEAIHLANGGNSIYLGGHRLSAGAMTVAGHLNIAGGTLAIASSVVVEADGDIVLLPYHASDYDTPPRLEVAGTLTVDGRLFGCGGSIRANVINRGQISCFLDLIDSPVPQVPGPLVILGDLLCSPDDPESSIWIEVSGAGASQHAGLRVEGSAQFKNWIGVYCDSRRPGFQPQPGDRFSLIDANNDGPGGTDAQWTGRFDRYGLAPGASAFLAINHDYENARLDPIELRHKSIQVLGVSNPARWSLGPPGTQSKMVVITHGTSSFIGPANDGGFGQMAHSMAQFAAFAGIDQDWDVYTVDWRQFSTHFSQLDYNPWESARIASEIAESLVQTGLDSHFLDQYAEFHVLSHSSGSWFADRFGDALARLRHPRPFVKVTVFDAFEPPTSMLGPLGESSTSLPEHYVDRAGLSPYGTNSVLPLCVNVDVTDIPGHPGGANPLDYHAWPYQWYLGTITDASVLPPPPACESLGWGFEQSPMYRQYLLSIGSQCPALPGPRGWLIHLPSLQPLRPPNVWTLVPFTVINSVFGSTGLGEILANAVARLTTGSPVVMTTTIETPGVVRSVSFDYAFEFESQGLLTVTFDGVEVFRSQQGFEPQGVLHSREVWLPADATPGPHAIAFTLEPNGGPQARVSLMGLRLGLAPEYCTSDFDGDGDTGTDADIESFFACLAGTCCASCASADFNGDGDTGTDGDIEAFFRVLAGGAC